MMRFLQRLKQNMQIKYSEKSILDLDAIIKYISKDSINRALLYADFLKSKLESKIIIRRILNSTVDYTRKKI